ncbi:hypothetical protein QAD02_000259 [Eretmocerus hayati]|uniref:Uncharacterized protein n=1 Tax=Eretmocerus hayati TaxID=131215 RepID=A0ACC2NHF5_9HYME|nr:hypothetical protein QAD02_000259 [Eretmocerus hayati]
MKIYVIQLAVACLCIYFGEVELIGVDKTRHVDDNEFQFFASLITIAPKYRIFCSGTIITGIQVLTTAGCIDKYPVEDSWVFAGSTEFTDTQKYQIEKWIKYSTWAGIRKRARDSGDPDIGIVKLKKRMYFGTSMTLALMPLEPRPLPTNKLEVSLIGWPDSLANNKMDLVTRKVTISRDECLKYTHEPIRTLVGDRKLFCTSPGVQMSKHDEGGPVIFRRNVLVGINYWRSISNKRPKVSVHIDLSHFKDFIDDITSS